MVLVTAKQAYLDIFEITGLFFHWETKFCFAVCLSFAIIEYSKREKSFQSTSKFQFKLNVYFSIPPKLNRSFRFFDYYQKWIFLLPKEWKVIVIINL